MIGIYCILNLINDKVYIGQSRNVERRIKQHIYYLTNSKHQNSHLQGAFDKYGLDNFVFSPMLECDENKLDYYEMKYISDFDAMNPETGYNLESGGNKNKKPSEETVMKLREAFKGENHPYYGTGALDKVGGVQFIKSEITKGNTQEDIAKKAGVSRGTLRDYLKARNLSWKDLGGRSKTGRNFGWSVFKELGGIPFLKSEICNGKSQVDIEREAGVSNGALYNYLKTRNLSWSDLGGNSKYNGCWGTSVYDKRGGVSFLKDEIRNGQSQRAIAKEAGTHPSTLRSYIKRRKYTWNELKEEALSEEGVRNCHHNGY